MTKCFICGLENSSTKRRSWSCFACFSEAVEFPNKYTLEQIDLFIDELQRLHGTEEYIDIFQHMKRKKLFDDKLDDIINE